MNRWNRNNRLLLGVLMLAATPALFGFLCLPLVAPGPSGLPAPTPAALFAPTVSAVVSNTSPGASSSLQASISLPAGSTLAIAAAFDIPAGWSVADDGPVTDGSLAGSVTGFMTIADPVFYDCGSTVSFYPIDGTEIALIEATTNSSVTISGADTDGDGRPQVVEDADADGLPDGVTKYPAFLTTVLPGTHKARYFGTTEVSGIADLYVNVVVDETAPGGPYAVTTIVNDPTSPPISAVAQFCAPQEMALTLLGTTLDNPDTAGTEGGQTLYTNPAAAGTYVFEAALVSEFDVDNDGVSNGFDNCPFTPNENQADADFDYAGDACDASPDTEEFDLDGDDVENGYDNCIFVANSATLGPDDQADADFDDIGDACDSNVTVPDGPNYYLICTDPAGIGVSDPGGAACATATPAPTPTATPKPPDGDTDGDTIPNATDPDDDNDGCLDAQELGGDPSLGGLRNPHNFWDFLDVPTGEPFARDLAVSVADIAGIVGRFGSAGDPGGDPLSVPPAAPAYHTAYDRGGTDGPYAWSLLPADGAISVGDILAAVNQFGHSCA